MSHFRSVAWGNPKLWEPGERSSDVVRAGPRGWSRIQLVLLPGAESACDALNHPTFPAQESTQNFPSPEWGVEVSESVQEGHNCDR